MGFISIQNLYLRNRAKWKRQRKKGKICETTVYWCVDGSVWTKTKLQKQKSSNEKFQQQQKHVSIYVVPVLNYMNAQCNVTQHFVQCACEHGIVLHWRLPTRINTGRAKEREWTRNGQTPTARNKSKTLTFSFISFLSFSRIQRTWIFCSLLCYRKYFFIIIAFTPNFYYILIFFCVCYNNQGEEKKNYVERKENSGKIKTKQRR